MNIFLLPKQLLMPSQLIEWQSKLSPVELINKMQYLASSSEGITENPLRLGLSETTFSLLLRGNGFELITRSRLPNATLYVSGVINGNDGGSIIEGRIHGSRFIYFWAFGLITMTLFVLINLAVNTLKDPDRQLNYSLAAILVAFTVPSISFFFDKLHLLETLKNSLSIV